MKGGVSGTGGKDEIRRIVREYYGRKLKSSSDLKTSACCGCGEPDGRVAGILSRIHDEVTSRYYGCGSVIPPIPEGMKVLDLGSGSGRDAFVLSKLVGEDGLVVGVDMTDEQLDVANRHIDYHTSLFGYKKPNVSFRKGYIELLEDAGISEGEFDIVVSNCVVNLSADKQAVLRQVFRALAPGGEFYFSDIYADRRIPADIAEHPVLYGECLGGALYLEDFRRMAARAGFVDCRAVESNPIEIQSPETAPLVGNIRFYSVTYRLFKIAGLEDACEDYGQTACYKGGIDGFPLFFDLDAGHRFEKGRVLPVCANTFLMLEKTRFRPYFDLSGDMSTHLGLFSDCGNPAPDSGVKPADGSCC